MRQALASTAAVKAAYNALLKTLLLLTSLRNRRIQGTLVFPVSYHAVSVVVDEKSEGRIYDNGCTSGEKMYSVFNVVERMRSIPEYFVLDLYCE